MLRSSLNTNARLNSLEEGTACIRHQENEHYDTGLGVSHP